MGLHIFTWVRPQEHFPGEHTDVPGAVAQQGNASLVMEVNTSSPLLPSGSTSAGIRVDDLGDEVVPR